MAKSGPTDDVAFTLRQGEGLCQEGCGASPGKGSRFIQGHDSRLKSMLYSAIRDDENAVVAIERVDEPDTKPRFVKATALLDEYGWPEPAPKRSRTRKPAAESGAEKPSRLQEIPRPKDKRRARARRSA